MERMRIKWVGNERGHSLFIVMVVGFVIFMIITHLLTSYMFQVRAVHLKEQDVRANLLIQGALPVWLARQDFADVDEIEHELFFDDGVVTFEIDPRSTESYWYVIVNAYVPDQNDPQATHMVHVHVEKETGNILSWKDL